MNGPEVDFGDMDLPQFVGEDNEMIHTENYYGGQAEGDYESLKEWGMNKDKGEEQNRVVEGDN